MAFEEKKADTFIAFEKAETPVFFDVWKNLVRSPEQNEGGEIRVKLAASQALVLLCGEGRQALPYDYEARATRPLEADWSVSLKDAGADTWREYGEMKGYVPFNTPENEPTFCGTLRYETVFSADGTETQLDLGLVGEIASVTLNGRSCGTVVAAPYVFDISKAVVAGAENCLTVTVVNNPVYRERYNDRYVTYLPMPASGLLGPVKIG